MNRRETVLRAIVLEVADEGKANAHAIRLMVENRISQPVFLKAVREGMEIFERNKIVAVA